MCKHPFIHFLQEILSLKFKFKRRADLPIAMSDAQCAVVEDRVYVGGGRGEDQSDHAAQSQVFEYSLAEKKWTSLSQNHVCYFGLTNFLGRLVSLGGMSSDNSITGDVSVFEFSKNRWDRKRLLPMQTKRFHPSVISHGSCLAVCGGIVPGGNPTNIVEVFVNGQWCQGPRLPHRICLAKPTIADHSCYLVGGAFSLTPLAPSNALISIPLSILLSPTPSDPYQNKWTEHRKHMCDFSTDKSSNYYPTITNHAGILLMIGGWSHTLSSPTDSVFAYSSEACMWVRADNLPEPCSRIAATPQLQNGAIMLIGGVDKANRKSACVFSMIQNF